jgi:prolyl-tRNA synthetase
VLPVAVAPYQVSLVALARREETWQAAEQVFAALVAGGIEVLYDDRRDLSAGVKFNDADLRGLPLRVVIGERSLASGGAELSLRGQRDRRTIPLDALPGMLHEELATLNASPMSHRLGDDAPYQRTKGDNNEYPATVDR